MWQQFTGMLRVWTLYFKWTGWFIIASFVMTTGYVLLRNRAARPFGDPVIVACFAALLAITVFTYLQGYHQPRLNVPMLSLIALMTFRLLAQAGRERLAAGLLGATALFSFIALWLAPAVTQT
jgi:hypothetical protein